MTVLSAGTNEFTTLSTVTIPAVEASFTPSGMSYSNQTVTYKSWNCKLILFETGFEYFIEISNCYKSLTEIQYFIQSLNW